MAKKIWLAIRTFFWFDPVLDPQDVMKPDKE
jgi:hypothetical protein